MQVPGLIDCGGWGADVVRGAGEEQEAAVFLADREGDFLRPQIVASESFREGQVGVGPIEDEGLQPLVELVLPVCHARADWLRIQRAGCGDRWSDIGIRQAIELESRQAELVRRADGVDSLADGRGTCKPPASCLRCVLHQSCI